MEAGANGVGLFRSEFLFMGRNSKIPSEDEQFEQYKKPWWR
jgi:phosphotransferase system enzyme I (PtsI)